MDIIYAPRASSSQTVYLKHVIAENRAHLKMLFPESNVINKHQHMVYYPTCIRMSGPMVSMQCMKYELKHGFSKRVTLRIFANQWHANIKFCNVLHGVEKK